MAKKKDKDAYLNLKHIAYSTYNMPPGKNFSLKDFVQYCKFYLCTKTKKPMKDPIWGTYTNEELIIEYFAWRFETEPQFRKDFEDKYNSSESVMDEFSKWADNQIEKNKDELKEKFKDNVSFDPTKDVIGGD